MSALEYDPLEFEIEILLERMQDDTSEDLRPEDLCPCPDPHCRSCGCCELNPCEDGCTRVEPDLCSRCVAGQAA
jgi:hypothetical protein